MNLDYTKKRYKEFWNKENDLPLYNITGKKEVKGLKEIKTPDTILGRWLDIDYNIALLNREVETTAYIGDSFPFGLINVGPDIFGAICGGCDLEFGDITSWAIPKTHNIEELEIGFDENNKWWKHLEAYTKAAVEDGKDKYLVTITDTHSGMDALVAMLGVEDTCMAIYDEPELVTEKLKEINKVYSEVTTRLQKITATQDGCTNWMRIYCEDFWQIIQCDFSALISQEQFNEFQLPCINHEMKHLNKSIYHLDGKDALKHLDTLLDINDLSGIQWVYGAGQPSAKSWMDVLKKIQKANKVFQVEFRPDDIEEMAQHMQPQGAHYINHISMTEEEAQTVYKRFVKAFQKKKYY